MATLFWILCFELMILSSYLAITQSLQFLRRVNVETLIQTTNEALKELKDFEDCILSGSPPTNWDGIKVLKAPWKDFFYESLRTLYDQGLPTHSTLKRFKKCAGDYLTQVLDAKAESAQPMLQAFIFLFVIPAFSIILAIALPQIRQKPYTFLFSTLMASSFTAFSSVWMLKFVEEARFGGLRREYQTWILSAQCTGEQFLAFLQAGFSSKKAWHLASDFLANHSPELAQAWKSDDLNSKDRVVESMIILAGREMKEIAIKAQTDGLDCARLTDRILADLKTQVDMTIKKKLKELGTKTLTPLFLGVLPSTFFILGVGIYLSKS